MIRQAKRLANLTLPTWREVGVNLRKKLTSALTVQVPLVNLEGARSDIHSDDFAGGMNDVGTSWTASIVTQANRAAEQCAQLIAQPRIDLANTNARTVVDRTIFALPAIGSASALPFINASGPRPMPSLAWLGWIKARIAIATSIGIAALRPIAALRAKTPRVAVKGFKFITAILAKFYRHTTLVVVNDYCVKLAVEAKASLGEI